MPGDADDGAVHLRRSDVEGAPDGFRLLMYNHALEHLADPLGELRSARQRVVAGGSLLVRIPLADSYAERT